VIFFNDQIDNSNLFNCISGSITSRGIVRDMFLGSPYLDVPKYNSGRTGPYDMILKGRMVFSMITKSFHPLAMESFQWVNYF
jgi:hypothetical protein